MSKGIMFSIILFFLSVTLVAFIAIQRSLVSERREQLYVETRISALNNMYDSVIRDAEKTFDTITRRAMIVCFNNISKEGVPIQEANETLKELILNGTMNGIQESIMENATFSYWVEKIEEVALLKGFNITIDNQTVEQTLEIKPYDSFNLLVQAKMNINITDLQGVAALKRSSIQVKKLVSVEGMEDPLYLLKSYGLMSNTITKSRYVGNYTQLILIGSSGNSYTYGNTTKNIADRQNKILIVDNASEVYLSGDLSGVIGVISQKNVVVPIGIPYVVNSSALSIMPENINVLLDGSNDKVWYIDNFKRHVENSYYQSSQDGASYLDRLEGSLSCNYCEPGKIMGLESFINKRNIPPEIPLDEEKTNIDYFYFSPGSLDGDRVKGISTSNNWFRIDNELVGTVGHQEIYNVTNLIE